MTWYGKTTVPDIRDVQLRSILVLGLNMNIRLDKISKISMEHIFTTSDDATLTPVESIKHSTVQRNYRLCEWDASTLL